MCAINGCTWNDEALIQRMNERTKHRGPDGTEVFTNEHISLGHNRLKIIDLSESARQPMESADGNSVIVFNGEIYNYLDIKRELKEYPFRSQSDTEVILAAYQKWGSACVERFNGIFAFALWDKKREELFVARDPLGVKPLYYFCTGGRFVFSSEIKAVLEYGMPRRVNREAFNHYMRLGYVPEPMTMFDGIHKFPAAHRGYVRQGKVVTERYWNVRPKPELFSWNDAVSETRSKVEAAVQRQLVSDRPVGVYLSGGIDSSAVLAAASRVHPHINTFSVGFDLTKEEQADKFNSDIELARRTAAFFGATHHEIHMSSVDIVPLFERAVQQLDEPINNSTILPMLCLSGFAREHVAVALGGDGGDEIFGGYDRYRLSRFASLWQSAVPQLVRERLGSKNERLRKMALPPGASRYVSLTTHASDIVERVVSSAWFDAGRTEQFFKDVFFSDIDPSIPFELSFMDVDRRSWLVDESLMMSDKMSMAHGLEMRVPFLDKEVVEFAAQLPLRYKTSLWETKRVLKAAFASSLPEYLFHQPKRGWVAPAAKWLRHSHVQAFARRVLSQEYYVGTRALFDWDELNRMLDEHIDKKCYNLDILWSVLTFQVWAAHYGVTV